MLQRLSAVFLLIYLTNQVHCQGYYTIVGSKYIRPNSNYHVAVSLYDTTEPSQIRLRIVEEKQSKSAVAGTDSPVNNIEDRDVKYAKNVTVDPLTTQTVDFQTGDMLEGNYKLVADGITGMHFMSEANLDFHSKSFSILIQTDKAIYKPGDTVKFRILILDPNMKPFEIKGPVNVYITDGKGNRIKQWSDVKFNTGVYGDELPLSEFPVLGDWTISVEVMGETKKKTIEVAEYVLPKFEVSIDTPKHQIYKDGKIRATIRSKYTYGKPVRGEATVSIQPKSFGYYQPLVGDVLNRKTTKIDGKGHVEFDMKDDLKITEEYERDYDIEAIVEEELTGRKQTGTTTITLHKYKYAIKTISDQNSYKPGLPFEITIQVAHHDGSPVLDSVNKITISYGTWYRFGESNSTKIERNLDSNGMVQLTLTFPKEENGYYVNAEYLGLTERLGYYSKAESDTGAYLQAVVKTQNPTINKDVSIEVQSTDKMKYLTYQIIGRGDVLASKTEEVPDATIHVFKFLATFAMVPKARLVVYYFKDGEIVSDRLDIEFGEDLQNFIKLDMSDVQAKPGADVDITVNTRPNSYVGLLGVDQSVLLLKKGNDLSKDEVLQELGQYNQYYSRWHPMWRKKRYSYPSYDWEDFNYIGAILLTNAKHPVRPYKPSTRNPNENEIFGSELTTIKKTDIGPAHIFKTNTKPPFAGPYAFSRIPKSKWQKNRVYLTQQIENTWLFLSFSARSEGRQTIHKKVPDTITSWIITGFSVDPVTGLGLTKTPRKLQVFQPFFVSLNLPYSIKRGEIVSIPIVVFNYMENDVNAEVTLHNEDQAFDFTEATNEVTETPKIELYRRKRLSIKSNDGSATSFMIKPKKVGPITIKVTATTPTAGDGVERILPVEPEGVPQFVNKAVFVDLREKSNANTNLTVDVPKNAVPDSTRVSVSVVGDLLGATIKNLDSLIRMPYGCGEQNMLNFVPNIIVINYLKSSNQLNPAIEAKAKKFMESGYQRELTYKHTDGSFSAFGNSDKNGSTWLTAFVARAFRQAADHIDIEEKVIDDALKWLSDVQAQNGSFPEVGHVSHSDMQGGAGQGIALTAYTLITFLENKSKIPTYRNTINKAMDYIIRNLENLDDTYALALAAYALQLAEHNSKDFILQSLDAKATTEGDRKWWHKPIPESDSKNVWHSKPNSVNVEMSAYGILALMEAGHVTACLPIVKWLLSQQNDRGGFQSTQDTVVGLQALAKFAEQISAKNNDIQLNIGYGDNAEANMRVNSENSIILQSYELPSSVKNINVSATGRGFALVQLSYQYNLNVTGAWPRFTLDPLVNKNSRPDYLHLTVCTSFIPAGGVNTSNMAVMEVSFPSGFTADLDTLPSLKSTENVKKVETKEGDTVVVLYFDDLGRKEICPTLDAFRTHKVAHQKPAPVTVYDYYDNSRRARMFYNIPEATLCDICENEDCGESCKIHAAEQKSDPDEFKEIWRVTSMANSHFNFSFILMVGMATILRRI